MQSNYPAPGLAQRKFVPQRTQTTAVPLGFERMALLGVLIFFTACHSGKTDSDKTAEKKDGPGGVIANLRGGSDDSESVHKKESASPRSDSKVSLSPPDKIVIILLDALRPDYLGFVDNNAPETAPGLARLSRRAAVFTRAFSTSSWTAPSTASIFTSLYPQGHGIQYGFNAQRSFTATYGDNDDVAEAELTLNRLPKNIRILPELLRDAGYETFAITTNINIDKPMGFHRGFNHFRHLPYDDAPAEVVTTHLHKWSKKIRRASKSFVYLHLNDPHMPYHPRRPWVGDAGLDSDPAGVYRSEISYADKYIQHMLKLMGVDDSTLLVVMSDHGEEFLDHGGIEHGPKLYQELIRVLLMIRWPRGQIATGRNDLNVSHIDILPTLLDFADIPIPTWCRGVSLAPVLRRSDGERTTTLLRHREIFAHRVYSKIFNLHTTALIQGQWKIINKYDEVFELYHHADDPGDHRELSDEHPKKLAEMTSRLTRMTRHLTRDKPVNEEIKIKLDKTLIERLNHLGYVTQPEAPISKKTPPENHR